MVGHEPAGELAGGRCFAGTLKAREENHGRRLHAEVEFALLGREVAPDDRGEFALHDADQGLAGIEVPDHLFAHCLFLDAREHFLHDGKRNVGFKERKAHLAEHILGVGFGKARLAAHCLDDLGKTLAE